MKTLSKIIALLVLMSASMAYATFEDHNGACHDKVNSPVQNCRMCDTMSRVLVD